MVFDNRTVSLISFVAGRGTASAEEDVVDSDRVAVLLHHLCVSEVMRLENDL
jgi:hypothetical protein